MRQAIDCFIPYVDAAQAKATIDGLRESALVNNIYLLATDAAATAVEGCTMVHIDALNSSDTMLKIAEAAKAPYSTVVHQIQQPRDGILCP